MVDGDTRPSRIAPQGAEAGLRDRRRAGTRAVDRDPLQVPNICYTRIPGCSGNLAANHFLSPPRHPRSALRASFLIYWSLMSEIDDIFARLGGGRVANTDQRDHRDIPRRGKVGGSRVVEVVHVATRQPGVGAAVTHRTESGVRAQTWDGGFPTRSAPHTSSPSPQPVAPKAPEQVGHVIVRWEPVAEVVPSTSHAPMPVEVQLNPVDKPTARSVRSNTRQNSRPVADPFNPEDDRANCLRCGYAVEAGRDRRGLTTCAACSS